LTQQIGLSRARSIMLSPPWAGESVLYDCRAGDLWVLSPLAREVVAFLLDSGSARERDILSVCLRLEQIEVSEAEVLATLADLAAHGIIDRPAL
jgi:PqqD family protein of HPr-rel-A system